MARSATRAKRERKQQDRLVGAFEAARRSFALGRLSAEQTSTWVAAPNSDQRLLGLVAMRVLIEAAASPSTFLEIAPPLIGDPDSTVSWQACIIVSESVQSSPDAVWHAILDHCDSPDEDLQAAISCVLLEDLLDAHFEEYFPRLKREFQSGHTGLQRLLHTCYLDMTSRQQSQVERFLKRGR